MKSLLERLKFRRAAGATQYPSILRYGGEGAASVLVIGDSWVNGRGLADGVAEAVGGRAATYGYSGHTSGQIAARLEGGDAALLTGQLGPVPTVVFLVGVNDAYLHVGAKAYGRAVETLRSIGATMADRVFVVAVPRVDMDAPERWWGSRAKRLVFRWVFDLGARDATDRYRRAAAPEITYDDFIPAYRADGPDYAPDGLHLLPERYVDLGRHIGRQVRVLTA